MRKSFLLFLSVICVIAFSCSDSDDGDDTGDGILSGLTLTSDRSYFSADGVDAVVFTVKDNTGKDVSTQCVYKANDQELVDNTLSSATPGTYKVVATYKGIVSNTLDVIAMNENVKLKVASDKKSIVADGGDFACLYLVDEEGSRIPGGEFYIDGKKLDSPYFGTTEAGMHRITAMWQGKEAEEALNLGAFKEGEFTARMLVESLTGTGCGYCTETIKLLTEGDALARKDPRIVLIETHYQGQSPDMWQKYDERSREMEKAFIAYFGSTGTPSVYLDRNKEKFSAKDMGPDGLLSAIKSKAGVAIAIKNSLSEDKKQVELTAVIGSKKSFNGKVIAALVEDGIYLSHNGLGMLEWFHTMRDYRPSFEGEEAVAFEPGAPKEIKFQLNMGNANPVNSTLVVFVTNEQGLVENVQQVVVGTNVGY